MLEVVSTASLRYYSTLGFQYLFKSCILSVSGGEEGACGEEWRYMTCEEEGGVKYLLIKEHDSVKFLHKFSQIANQKAIEAG